MLLRALLQLSPLHFSFPPLIFFPFYLLLVFLSSLVYIPFSIFSSPISIPLLLLAFSITSLLFYSRTLGHLFALLFVPSFLCYFIYSLAFSAREKDQSPERNNHQISLLIEIIYRKVPCAFTYHFFIQNKLCHIYMYKD